MPRTARSIRASIMPGAVRQLLILIIVLVAVFFFLESNYFTLGEIKIEGNERLTRTEVIRLLDVSEGSNLFTLVPRRLEERLELHPLVARAKISRDLPSGLKVVLAERKPVALVIVNQGFIEVDGQGIYLLKKPFIGNHNLPLVTGITVDPAAVPGRRLDNPDLQLALAILAASPQELIQSWREVDISRKENIRIFTQQGFTIYLGKTDELQDKLKTVLIFYRGQDSTGWKRRIDYLDLRYGPAGVVKYSEVK